MRGPPVDGKAAGLLERCDQPLNAIGGELGASDSPRGEVGYLIGMDGAAAYERGEAVVADAEVLARLLARQDVRISDEVSLADAVM